MATREIVESTCDKCGVSARMDMPDDRKEAIVLPPKWMHVSGVTANTAIINLDLCQDCTIIILKAAGRFPQGT